MSRAFGRIVFALMGAAFGALAVSLVEGREAAAAVEGSHPPALGAVVLAEIGVLAPIALAIGVAVAAASLFLEPGRPLAPSERIAAARAEPVLARSRTAALAFLTGVGATTWLVTTAQVARRALADGAPLAAGGALAVSSVAWLLAFSALALAVLPSMRRGLASAASRWPRAIDPATTGGLGLVLGVGVVALGVTMGDTGGEGAGPLAILGVLKRNELDLRPIVDLVAIAVCAWIGPLALSGRPARPLPLVVALALVVAPVLVTAREAHALNDDEAVARAIERHAPLGHSALALVRKATDRDHDGASALFGGGDCNDRDPRISPLAIDVAGNGIDEDCSGADMPVPTPAATTSAGAAAPAEGPARPPSLERDLNVILVTVDTLRAGECGFLGYDRPTTPNLDALAAESVVFDRAYAMASYTGKALAPMLIGRYPSETLRDGGHFNTYAPGNTFLAERLHDAGLRTMGAASHWYFKERFGVTQGFDTFDLSAVPSAGQTDTDTTSTSRQLTDAAERLLEGNAGSGHFFLWVHYFDPHLQYVAHDGAPDFTDPAHPQGWRMHAAYDGEVWFTDQQLGRLLDYARAQPWWKDTVVVVTADHGEALGEHGINFQHGWEIWEPLMRIPLVFRVPGVQAHRVPVKRSAVDIVPTILDLLRVQAKPGELSGQSMLADLLAKPGDAYAERDVYLDMPDGPYTHMRRGIIHGATPGKKLVNFGGRQYQLYDLAADPGEHEDLAGDKTELAPMVEALQAKRATLKEIDVKADAPASQ
ncbi:MAG TPA: sulfatase-like hydrolase/transferase [Polyangiaceae bacterium]